MPTDKNIYIIALQSLENKVSKILAPTECPSCGAHLERIKDQLFCPNNVDCPAQSSGKIINFCKKLKIKGFGEATVEKLGLQSVEDLATLTVAKAEAAQFSSHMANKLVDTITTRLQNKIATHEFLAAMSIPLFGDSAGSKLKGVPLDNISYEVCKEKGLGDKLTENLIEWLQLDWPEIKEIWQPYLYTEAAALVPTKTTNGLIVVITGKLNDFKNRTDASKFLEEKGFTVKSSVTKDTNYLICEGGTTGSSYQKAKSLNIPIITLEELLQNV